MFRFDILLSSMSLFSFFFFFIDIISHVSVLLNHLPIYCTILPSLSLMKVDQKFTVRDLGVPDLLPSIPREDFPLL